MRPGAADKRAPALSEATRSRKSPRSLPAGAHWVSVGGETGFLGQPAAGQKPGLSLRSADYCGVR
jgi:hypothetical protein